MKRLFSLLLTFCMLLSAFCTFLPAFAADGDMTYLYYDADSKTMKTGTKASGEYTVLSSGTSFGADGATTWLYANANITFSSRTSMLGDVHLVLADGIALQFSYGISVNSSSSFTIYAQSEGETAGTLTAGAVDYNAAIGGGIRGNPVSPTADSGTITIHGGTITATGGAQGAGIGGGTGGSGGVITINGGNITAEGGTYAAGIGGGDEGSAGEITINGGVVTATGGEYNSSREGLINGGSGIGNGSSASGGTVTINDGVVSATGGAKGAGIGGGMYGSGCIVVVNGGTVNATAGSGAIGIGKGLSGDSEGTFDTGTDGTAVVFATSIGDSDSASWTGIVFVGTSGKVYGTSASPSASFEIPSGYTLTISRGQTVTIPDGVELINLGTIVIDEGGSLIVNGRITDNGTVTNNGTFTGNTDGGGCIKHSYQDNGICKVCGAYEPAARIADEASEHNGYYQIENPGNFLWFAEFVNSNNKDANAVLTADMDMSGITEYTPIGQTASYHKENATATDTGYAGVFDGNGFAVKNLSITGGSGSDILSYGIFGTVSGTVKKLGADTFTFTVGSADCRAGSIAGQVLAGGVITDCYVINSSVLTENKIAGGVAGCNYGGTVKNCYAYTCTISAYGSRGGFVVGDSRADGGETDRPGYVDNCYAANCTYTASDNGSYSNVVGTQSVSANVTKCAALTAQQFASGEAAYLLNGESSEGVWGQNVTSGSYPVIGGAAVYKVKSGLCSDSEEALSTVYANTNKNIITHNEDTELTNGICPYCSIYQAAVLTTDKYDIDGDGAYDSVYEIANAGQLYWFAEKVNSGGDNRYINGVLADNITVNRNLLTELITVAADLSATVKEGKTVRSWTPIGKRGNVYSGTFDGQGFYVSGLYCNNSSADYVGLFGAVGGTIKNLCVKDSYFCGKECVGAVAGLGTTTEKCISDGNIVKGTYNVGGVCGYVSSGTLSDCFNSSTVSGYKSVGGIVGYSNKGADATVPPVVKNCLTVGTVSGTSSVGEVCGKANEAVVQNCYYLGTAASAGVGENNGTSTITNVEAKSAGQLASGEVARLLGKAWGQTIGTDEYPILGDDGVYKYIDTDVYTNELKFGFAEISEDAKTAKVNIPTAGTYTVIFADYEGNRFLDSDIVVIPVSEEDVGECTAESELTLGRGDKILFWGAVGGMRSLCGAMVIE